MVAPNVAVLLGGLSEHDNRLTVPGDQDSGVTATESGLYTGEAGAGWSEVDLVFHQNALDLARATQSCKFL